MTKRKMMTQLVGAFQFQNGMWEFQFVHKQDLIQQGQDA